MSEVIAFPRIVMTVETTHGYVDHGGLRYGFMLLVSESRVRMWRVVDGKAVDGPVPDAVRAWIVDRCREMLTNFSDD